jgi:hypothetical protein
MVRRVPIWPSPSRSMMTVRFDGWWTEFTLGAWNLRCFPLFCAWPAVNMMRFSLLDRSFPSFVIDHLFWVS